MRLHLSALLGLYLFSAALVTLAAVVLPNIDRNRKAMFADVVEGTAHRPYVYRALVPTVIRVARSVVPESVRAKLTESFERKAIVKGLQWRADYALEYLLTILIFIPCYVAFGWCMRDLSRRCYPSLTGLQADFAGLMSILVVPLLFSYNCYLYDPATLFLFTLGIVLVVRERFLWLLLLMPIATLNRETAILLVAVMAVWPKKSLHGPRPMLLGVAMTAAWLIVKIAVSIRYAGNPGSVVEFRLLDHNLVAYRYAPQFVQAVLVCLILFFAVRRGWPKASVELRRCLIFVGTPLLVLAVFFGFIDELRIYYEVLPFIILVALPGLFDTARVQEPTAEFLT